MALSWRMGRRVTCIFVSLWLSRIIIVRSFLNLGKEQDDDRTAGESRSLY